MDLSKKTVQIKTEYVEENIDFTMKEESLAVMQRMPVVDHRSLLDYSPRIHHPQLFQPFPPPFYHHPLSTFNLLPLQSQALHDVFDQNIKEMENYKRKSTSKIHDSNKKVKDRLSNNDVSCIQHLPPNQEKETKPSDENSATTGKSEKGSRQKMIFFMEL